MTRTIYIQQDWFINSYMLNEVGRSPLVSGFFWDDVWNEDCDIHDQVNDTCVDMGFKCSQNDKGEPWKCEDPALVQLTADYQRNMQALREAVLEAGKFTWQMLWTGGSDTNIGGGSLAPLVTRGKCAEQLRSMCNMSSPAQTRAMAYGLNGTSAKPTDVMNDMVNFLLTRSPYSWLGWGWDNAPAYKNVHGGCSREYYWPPEFDVDYGQPAAGAEGLCKETASGSQVFVREYSKATIQMDCNKWEGIVKMKV